MHGLSVVPHRPGSAELGEFPEPETPPGWLLVGALAVGVCVTDREIVAGVHGEAPPDQKRLGIGHESLGRVLRAPRGSGFAPGDLVASIVRRPDPVPCSSCAAGEWDMCRNGRYVELGIKGLDGCCRERYPLDPAFAIKVDPKLGPVGVLLEPASVLAKAWEHIERIGRRASWRPRKVLVTGAGPVGLLGALFATKLGLDVHVLDHVTDGPKPGLVRDLGATYHSDGIEEAAERADVILECTGSSRLVFAALGLTTHAGILCLTGLSTGARMLEVDVAELNCRMVLENDVMFGSVNANRRHYESAAAVLARSDRSWLGRLLTRPVPLEGWSEALHAERDDVKTVIDFTL